MSCSISWGFFSFGNGTVYFFPFGNSGAQTTNETLAQWPVPRNCRIQNLRVRVRGAVAGGTVTISVRQNGGTTPLSVTMQVGDLSADDLTHSVLFNPGDLISLQKTGLVATATAYVISADFRPA